VMTTNLRSPRNHTVIVSLVGPITNYILAALMGVCFVAAGGRTTLLTGAAPSLLQQIFFYAGLANIVLGTFNLIPCPPLDGAAVLERFLPEHLLPGYYNLQPFLMFLPFILILLFHGAWASLIDHLETWYLQRLV
jgi:Zn-dependent protease